MTFRTFKRQFTDNNKYGEYEKVPYMNALAHVVEEYVYSDKLDDDYFSYNMTEVIPMFDFMTLVAYFISESHKEFGKSTIVGYIEDLKSQYRLPKRTCVEYPDNNLLVTCASYGLILDLLWTTFIYASAHYLWSKNEEYADTASMIYSVMKAESGLNKMAFLSRPIVKNMDSAKKMMLSYMVRSELRNEHKKESAVEVPVEEASNLLARNAELIQRQEALQSEEPAEEIEWHDKVRLELLLRLLENGGTDMKEVVKVRVAEVMQCVTGLPISTCKNYCTNRDLSIKTHEKEILKLNSKLQAIGISILL